MSQHDISETSIKCHVCNGTGYMLDVSADNEPFSYDCRACDGTGLSFYGRTMNDLDSVFTCKVCGANKVHYRLYGYRCPHHCEDES